MLGPQLVAGGGRGGLNLLLRMRRIGLLRGPAEVPGGRFRGLGACAKVVRKGFGRIGLLAHGAFELTTPSKARRYSFDMDFVL